MNDGTPMRATWNRILEWGWLPLYLLIVVIALLTRPLMPVDETRYVGVAWDMWQSGSWVVPLLNAEPYSHKPPLLFWLIHVGWALFGVNEITPRLVGPAFALGSRSEEHTSELQSRPNLV